MIRLRRIVSNTIISLFGQIITWASTLLLTSAYGRFLGDAKFGELYFAITFVALIGFPLEFGFNQQLTRDVARDSQKALSYLSNTLLIKTVFWLVFYGLILLFCWLLGYSAEERLLVAICGITLLSSSIVNAFGAIHYAFERAVFPALGTVLEKGLAAIIGIVLLRYFGAGVEAMALVLLGGSLINASWQAMWFSRLVGVRLSLNWAVMRGLVRTSIPFLVYGVLGVIYYRIDTVLLSLFTNTEVVGWYGASYRLFDTLVFLPNLVIIAIMYPVFSKLSTASEPQLKVAIEKSLNFLLFCGLPIATGMIFAAPNIIGFLYHRREFLPSVPVLQWLAPGIVFLYLNTVFNTVLMSTNREKKITLMAGIALIFNLTLNLVLIPLYRHVGAAIVTSLTEFLLFCLSLVFVPRRLLSPRAITTTVKVLVGCLAMALVITLMRQLSVLIILPVALVAYLGAATLLGAIPRKDLAVLYSAVRRKAQSRQSVPETPLPEFEVEDTLKVTSSLRAIANSVNPLESVETPMVE